MKALPTANESDRLRVLREYQVLDTDAEQSFDDIVRLAAHVFHVPAAMVTLVDESRQWFKSSQGLPFTETHRDWSFCAHAILSPDTLIVPDATTDARFADNPLVTGPPYIRFYAGAPLVSSEGFALGTLSVIDFTPRHPAPEQVDALQILGRQVMAQLELRRQVALKRERAAAAETTLQTATELHRALFDSALDAIVTLDASGRVTGFNTAAEHLFGYTRTEAVGSVMADLIIPPEHREQHSRGLARYISTGEAVILGRRVEVTAMRRDGSRFPAELTVQRLGHGEPVVFSGFIRDITARIRATQELEASADQYRRQRAALTGLIQDERLYHGELSQALRQITQTAAALVNVARVSVWQYVSDRSRIRCLDLYDASADRHSSGAEISASTVPAYFDAMAGSEVIAAHDARTDPRTREFNDDYLIPLGITSMLDARIHLHGTLHGVLCLEHVGPSREWTAEEESFAAATANLVSLALEGHKRWQAQDALITQTEILTAVTESLAAFVERHDWKGALSRLLRCALDLTGSEYGFIGVVVEGPILRVLAHEGIVWDSVLNREFYEQALRDYEQQGYVTFHNLNNLFGRAITSGEVVTANDPDRDPRSGGRPAGHPPMTSFLGVPIRGREGVTGLIALANRSGGYGREESRRIELLVQQAGGLCESYRQRERMLAQDAERKSVEAALRTSEERLRLVARATNDAVWDRDLETNALFIPEGFRKLFGEDTEQPHTTLETWARRVHPDDRARIESGLRAAIDGGANVWSDEYRFQRTDGSYAYIFDRGYVLRNEQGRPLRMIGAMMDISERKQLEAQFRQAQKLEAVGQLAGGVAHDFNNILTVIEGHASLLMEAGVGQDATDSVRQIAEAAERAAALTRQLLAFSRKQILQVTDVDMNEIVGKMMRLLQRVLGEHIRLEIESSAMPAYVRADASMMEQVILNLAINARDAMPGGGRLTLRTTSDRIDAKAMPDHADARPGTFVRVSITDSGSGIAPEILPNIFEPFFTTKGVERGTGLGLATVYGVVKQHQGWVTVRSVVGAGTTFHVYLPAAVEPAKSSAVKGHEGSAVGGRETILLVEDEAPVRRLARQLLERHGYAVLEAESGPAALAIWQTHRGRIDLVLTDMVMPDGLSGLDLAARLLAENPQLNVIVTSGYSVDLVGRDLTVTERVRFLAKPYSVRQLIQAVRGSLDAR